MVATRTTTLLSGLMLLPLAALMAQDQPATNQGEGERSRAIHRKDEVELPIPIASPTAVLPGTIEPLTPREKAARALKNTFGPQALANRALLAGINQWMDKPEEWQSGWGGYGQRYASRWGRLAVRNGLELTTDVIMKTDSRYDRCACTGFLARTGHAWRRVFVARKDDGGETVNVTRLVGAYVTPMITDQWYPARLNTWGHKLDSGTQFLGWRGLTNMLREFWPEVSRKLPVGKNYYR